MLHLGIAELGGRRHQRDVAGEGEPSAAAHGGAVDGGDDRFGQARKDAVQVHRQLGAALDQMGLVGRQILELGQIGAGTEGGSGAREHDAAYAVVGFRVVQGLEQSIASARD